MRERPGCGPPGRRCGRRRRLRAPQRSFSLRCGAQQHASEARSAAACRLRYWIASHCEATADGTSGWGCGPDGRWGLQRLLLAGADVDNLAGVVGKCRRRAPVPVLQSHGGWLRGGRVHTLVDLIGTVSANVWRPRPPKRTSRTQYRHKRRPQPSRHPESLADAAPGRQHHNAQERTPPQQLAQHFSPQPIGHQPPLGPHSDGVRALDGHRGRSR